jgi:hypothetical protein
MTTKNGFHSFESAPFYFVFFAAIEVYPFCRWHASLQAFEFMVAYDRGIKSITSHVVRERRGESCEHYELQLTLITDH